VSVAKQVKPDAATLQGVLRILQRREKEHDKKAKAYAKEGGPMLTSALYEHAAATECDAIFQALAALAGDAR